MTYESTKQVIYPLIIGNWKMFGLNESNRELLTQIALNHSEQNVIICPPFTALRTLNRALDNIPIKLGGQDCHPEAEGAYTGDISASMLKNAGCDYVIVGHSERRRYHKESNEQIHCKINAAHHNQLAAILCIGESAEAYAAGETLDVIKTQLDECLPEQINAANTIIAYEPVWAIGSGKTPNRTEIETAHRFIEEYLHERFPKLTRTPHILYGGSVTQINAGELLTIPHVYGLLVGSASLNAKAFCEIVHCSAARTNFLRNKAGLPPR